MRRSIAALNSIQREGRKRQRPVPALEAWRLLQRRVQGARSCDRYSRNVFLGQARDGIDPITIRRMSLLLHLRWKIDEKCLTKAFQRLPAPAAIACVCVPLP